jgi:hypothetical protein
MKLLNFVSPNLLLLHPCYENLWVTVFYNTLIGYYTNKKGILLNWCQHAVVNIPVLLASDLTDFT